MSTPHIILEICHLFGKNRQIWWQFDVVITKIILLVFLRHGVAVKVVNCWIVDGYINCFLLTNQWLNCTTYMLLIELFCSVNNNK